jgi:hypothetical protein
MLRFDQVIYSFILFLPPYPFFLLQRMVFDEYVRDIVQSAPSSVSEIELLADGSWRPHGTVSDANNNDDDDDDDEKDKSASSSQIKL